MIVKAIDDTRAMTDIGSAIFVKRAGQTKYSLWLAVTNIPATGSAPEQVETTVTTSRKKTYTYGRQDNAQKECTFMAHRNNFKLLKGDYNKQLDFLQINPDGTGWKFQGYVSFYQDEITVGSNLTGKAVITVSSSEELPLEDVTDIIQDTVTFVSAIPADVKISATAGSTVTFSVVTDPADATITVTSGTTSVCTAAISLGVVTLTSVTAGSSLIEISAAKNNLTTGKSYVLAIVA